MNIYRTKIKISLAQLILGLLIITTAFLIYFYTNGKMSEKWAPIIGGMAVSSLVSLIQFGINYKNYRNSEKLQDCGVKEFLNTRGDKDYYSKLIRNSNKDLRLIFNTSKRFFEDFCQEEDGDNLLTTKLDSNPDMSVKMLLTDIDYLSDDDKTSFDISQNEIARLTEKYQERFQVRFYRHVPNHNIFLTDSDAVIGPYFEQRKGKYLPSIHFNSNANFVAPYITYFENEWKNAKS